MEDTPALSANSGPLQPPHSLNIEGLDGSTFQIQVDFGGFVHLCHEMVLVISCNALCLCL